MGSHVRITQDMRKGSELDKVGALEIPEFVYTNQENRRHLDSTTTTIAVHVKTIQCPTALPRIPTMCRSTTHVPKHWS